MPKLKQNPEQFANKYLAETIKAALNMYGTSTEEAAAILCMTERTLYNRFRKPESFTVSEIRKMHKRLHIPLDELTRGVFATVSR